MRTIKVIAVLAVAALTGTAALAGDLIATTVTTANGSQAQQVILFRPYNETSVALYTSGRGAGMMMAPAMQSPGELTPVTHTNYKEQAITLFWAQ